MALSPRIVEMRYYPNSRLDLPRAEDTSGSRASREWTSGKITSLIVFLVHSLEH
jgi:hypothetical protein